MHAASRRVSWLSQSLIPAVCLCALSGCVVPFQPGTVVEDAKLKQELDDASRLYPESFKVLHRAFLTKSIVQTEFSGSVVAKPPGTFRSMAVNNLGATCFDVVMVDGETPRILKIMPGLKRAYISEGMVESFRLMYLWRPGPESVDCRSLTGRLALLDQKGTEAYYMSFRPAEGAEELVPDQLISAREGSCLRRVTLSDYREQPGWRRKFPHRLELEDFVFGYRMVITVLEMKAQPLPEELLRPAAVETARKSWFSGG